MAIEGSTITTRVIPKEIDDLYIATNAYKAKIQDIFDRSIGKHTKASLKNLGDCILPLLDEISGLEEDVNSFAPSLKKTGILEMISTMKFVMQFFENQIDSLETGLQTLEAGSQGKKDSIAISKATITLFQALLDRFPIERGLTLKEGKSTSVYEITINEIPYALKVFARRTRGQNAAKFHLAASGQKGILPLFYAGKLGDKYVHITPLADRSLDNTTPDKEKYTYYHAVLQRMLKAISKLHSLEIIHSGICPSNIVALEEGPPLGFYLNNFSSSGFSMYKEEVRYRRAYKPPEKIFSKKNDLWMLGVSMFRMLTGEEPFSYRVLHIRGHMFQTSVDKLLERLLSKTPVKERLDMIDPERKLINFILKNLLRSDPEERPDASSLLKTLTFTSTEVAISSAASAASAAGAPSRDTPDTFQLSPSPEP